MNKSTRSLARSLNGFPDGFWWLWTSTLVNRLGTFVFPFLAIYLTSVLGYSAAHAGLILAIYGVGASVGALLGGELSDRIGRRATMGGAQLVTAVVTAAMGFVTGSTAIAVLAFSVGAAASASRPAISAMIVDLVPPEDRQRAFSVNYWASNIGFGFSAAVAGVLAHQGYLWLFIGDAVTTLLCAVVMWVKLPETRPAGPEVPSPVPAARVGLGHILGDSRFLVLCLLGFAMWMMFYQGSSSLSVAMAGSGIGTQAYGLIIALNGILIVVLQIPVTSMLKGRDRRMVLALSALLTGVGFGVNGFAGTSVILYSLSVMVWTLGEIAYAPASAAAVAELSDERAHGRYQGLFGFSTSVASILAPLVGGLALDLWGGPALWLLCVAVGVATAAGFWALLTVTRRASGRSDVVPESEPPLLEQEQERELVPSSPTRSPVA
ncbi:putative MFS family arabinose efflux permease [Micromonospora pisi]|uniref:Putative MFS family arabinose efflux permease n=1 Tax=Micromonospora pisi TaxID=589240 RepID=A0A495JTE1_9ACTN|nr:MFS transporter [Micromonospora pisi]RKR91815.1 putative MFS family arabinose efflux permease [Micromonospora pisi]